MPLLREYMKDLNALDDTFNTQDPSKIKVNYFNVLVVGASKSGKFSFTRFLFEHCFQKKFEIDEEEKLFREFVHRIQNGRRGFRAISLIHSKGFSDDYPIRDWYKNIKKTINQRMENYDEIRSYFYKEKSLFKQNL